VDPSAGLDEVEKRKFLTQLGLELRPFGRPAPSQSLYRLRYPSSYLSRSTNNNAIIMNFSPEFYYFPFLRSKCSPQYPRK
jgi:hypothetical protein